ncbi:MAG: hypothetical protein EZS28_010173 [Streblomastix strix]|uniref:RRM domain-containing protein n=1 Tax=Streblomastix strix TaxID=222440 RepID=A0A5J4WI85_9EUKA|nr:MAG: hypothetical protein EZS28_010173 [Streblomastix strix]
MKLYVGNLNYKTSEEQLRQLFASIGSVISVLIPIQSGRGRGYGFVTMEDEESANKCILKLDGIEVDGRNIHVEISKNQNRGKKIAVNRAKIETNELFADYALYAKIALDLKIPLDGTDEQKKQILNEQEIDCEFLINTIKDKKCDEGRKKVFEAGIIEGFLYIFENREINQTSRKITFTFSNLTPSCNNEELLLIFAKNPFPGLLRLLEHSDVDIVNDGICSIYNILNAGLNTTPVDSLHPHYDEMLKYGGIEKIFNLFKKNLNKFSRDHSALTIGQLF